MIIEIILILGVLYCVGVAIYLQTQYRKTNIIPKTKKRHGVVTEDDIVKKRHYYPRQIQTNHTTDSKGESIEDKGITFVPESEKIEVAKVENSDLRSSQIPKERLDDAFSESQEHEREIDDVLLNFENEQDDIDTDDEDVSLDEQMQESASGVDFNSLNSAVKVTSEPQASKAQKDEAGKTFLQIENSDIYNQLTDDNPKRKQMIDSLIDRHLKEYYKKSNNNNRSELGAMPKDYEDFNMSDFV